jgi:hypothetical protein
MSFVNDNWEGSGRNRDFDVANEALVTHSSVSNAVYVQKINPRSLIFQKFPKLKTKL